jgi:hypothetical protein
MFVNFCSKLAFLKFNRLTYTSQRTTRYHAPLPANLFQNASNFFKQRLRFQAVAFVPIPIAIS